MVVLYINPRISCNLIRGFSFYNVNTIGSVVPIHIRMESTPTELLKRVEGHRVIARSAGDVISQHYTEGFAPCYDLI